MHEDSDVKKWQVENTQIWSNETHFILGEARKSVALLKGSQASSARPCRSNVEAEQGVGCSNISSSTN
jgi:hypothetical protein